MAVGAVPCLRPRILHEAAPVGRVPGRDVRIVAACFDVTDVTTINHPSILRMSHAFVDRSAHARLVALERRTPASSSAAVIAYHELVPPRDAGTLPVWARAAQRVAGALAGILGTVLFTNSRAALDGPPFSRVVHADLLQLAGWGPSVAPRALCGLKITAVLHGWSIGALPEHVLMLDHDLVVVRPRAVLGMFEPLAHYDLAGVMEGMSRGWDGKDPNQRNDSLATPPDPAGRGWEVNSGVLAIRKQAEWLVKLWAAEFRAGLATYSRLTGVDQSALMWVLAHEPRARLFPMPPLYNFRQPVLYSKDLGAPIVFHSRAALRSPSSGATSKAMARVATAAAEEATRKIGAVRMPSEAPRSAAGRRHGRRLMSTSSMADSLRCPTDQLLRVACVGDSLTRGDGLHEHPPSRRVPAWHLRQNQLPLRERGSYPALLQRLLGQRRFDVRNFGHGGTTACNLSGGRGPPYVATREFPAALRFQPHLVVLMLGTNDAKDFLWRACGAPRVRNGLEDIVRAFASSRTPPRLLLLLTPPPMVGDEAWAIRSSLLEPVRAAVSESAAAIRAEHATRGMRVRLLPAVPLAPPAVFSSDRLHLDANGSALLACDVHDALRGQLGAELGDTSGDGESSSTSSPTLLDDCSRPRRRSRSCFDPFCVDGAPGQPAFFSEDDFDDDEHDRRCDEPSGIGAPYVQTGMACSQPRGREYARQSCMRLRRAYNMQPAAPFGGEPTPSAAAPPSLAVVPSATARPGQTTSAAVPLLRAALVMLIMVLVATRRTRRWYCDSERPGASTPRFVPWAPPPPRSGRVEWDE